MHIVELLSKGHFGEISFVLCREVAPITYNELLWGLVMITINSDSTGLLWEF